jgi:hypothetical protein
MADKNYGSGLPRPPNGTAQQTSGGVPNQNMAVLFDGPAGRGASLGAAFSNNIFGGSFTGTGLPSRAGTRPRRDWDAGTCFSRRCTGLRRFKAVGAP